MKKFKHKTELHCKHCDTKIWSRWSGSFTVHRCESAGLISQSYDHDSRKYKPDYPYMAIDETEYYCRILGDPKHFTVVEVPCTSESSDQKQPSSPQ